MCSVDERNVVTNVFGILFGRARHGPGIEAQAPALGIVPERNRPDRFAAQDELYFDLEAVADQQGRKSGQRARRAAARQEGRESGVIERTDRKPHAQVALPDALARAGGGAQFRGRRPEARTLFGRHVVPASDKLLHRHRHPEVIAQHLAELLGRDRPMPNATADGITMINFGMGSANAATVMDLLSAIAPKAVLLLGKCGGLKRKNQIGDLSRSFRPDLIVIDEAHERGIQIDLLLLLLKRLIKLRPEFKLVIMSATVNEKVFIDYFPTNEFKFAMVNAGERPNFPIEEYFLEEFSQYKKPINKFDKEGNLINAEDYVNVAVEQVIKIMTNTEKGDILVFFTGSKEIQDGCVQLHSKLQQINKNNYIKNS